MTRIADGPYRQVEAEAFRPGLDDQVAVPGDEPAILPPPELPGAPLVEAIELPAAGEGGPVRLAVRADPWRGPYAVLAGSAGSGLAPLATAVEPARIGSTLAAFPPGPLWRWDRQSVLDLRLEGGSLATLSESAVLAGCNLLALIGADGAIEIVAARKAELVGVGRYRLSEFLRGLALSEPEAARMLPPGARVLVLDDALVDLGNAGWEPGRETALRIVPAGRDAGDPASVPLSVSARGLAARPLAPVHPRLRREAGGVRLSFARRPRYGGDSFDLYEVPLHEETERYRLDILDGANVKRRVDLSASEYFYPLADELADFGAPNLALDLRLEQISASWGPGSARVATVPVEGTAP